MGVYIEGMKMPKVCGECKLHFLSGDGYVCCLITDRVPKRVGKFADSKTDLDFRWPSIMQVERPKWCPLVEVPEPHGRLMDLDAWLKNNGMSGDCKYCADRNNRISLYEKNYSKCDICNIVDDERTIVVVEAEGEQC